MDLKELQNQFISRVETASGKPVLVQSNASFAGHAIIRLATKEQPASVLLYKPELEAVLPYLVAFQCELALRTLLAEPQSQFDLVDRSNMLQEVLALVTKHLEHRKDIGEEAVKHLASRFGHGLGYQLRSMPIAMRVDQIIFANHPSLRELQRKSLDTQLQENMLSINPKAKEIAPPEVVKPNASMNAAFAKFFSETFAEPTTNTAVFFVPYVAAGYGQVANELLEIHQNIPADPNSDRDLVEAWAKHLGLDRWFMTRSR